LSTNQQQIQSYAYAPSATPENKASSPIYVLLAGIGAIEATGIDTIIRPISHRIVVEAQEFRIRALAKHVHRHGTHLVILDDDSIPYPNHLIPFRDSVHSASCAIKGPSIFSGRREGGYL
jgi:hypothetical protein